MTTNHASTTICTNLAGDEKSGCGIEDDFDGVRGAPRALLADMMRGAQIVWREDVGPVR